MSGLWLRMPITCIICCVAAYSLAGLPGPTSGFVSKELFINSILSLRGEYGVYSFIEVSLAIIGSAFVVGTALRLTVGIFFSRNKLFGELDQHHKRPCDPGILLWAPAGLLAAGTLVLGLNPRGVEQYFQQRFFELGVVHQSIDPGAHLYEFWHGWNPAVFVSLAAALFGLLLFVLNSSR